MNVAQWLNAIDLGQYEALFREHEIDANVLPDLVEADLEKIGVPLGHRKRLMRAIAVLSAGGTPPSAAKPASAQPSPSPPTSGAEAERRPITVMFCDLVGSTGLATRLDAEDWRNLVGAYLDEASAAVTGLGGHVLKKLGDGLMALFGYPHAQENDAERAVRASLAIQRALGELNARNAGRDAPQLVARIGLESGQVVVDATGEVFGEAPNVAARVQAAAEPGTVLVTASVQRQTAGLFVVEDKGAHDLKGVPAPVALFRIVRASGGGRRGGTRALTPLVGREEELALLTRRWSRAVEGEGQFVQIVGEPGIGKSRLIEEFRAKLAETPHTWVEWAASQLLQNTPLHPLAEWGRLRFGGADATDEGRLADLENTLRLIGLDAAEYAPLLAPLVDIPLREDRRARFAPEELRRRQLAAMTAWVLAGARSQPAVIAFEDLHWADPTSLDLMARLAERGAQSPLLVVATTRPEFRAPWAMRSHHGVVSLAPLDRAQVRRMVGEIASRHALSDEMIDGVGERTGGVPLFVEEVTRLLLERNAQGGTQAIPPTLQQSLAARLDRLGEAREVAQIGAVLGREFSYRLLSDVSSSAAGFDEPRLQGALDRLTEADLLFADGAPPTAAYRFKHALIQDAAYESLLKSRRQALHRRAAEALRDANAEPEAIAHHFTEAGLDDLAIEWWGRAGDQALRRSAFQEAIAHLGKAIAMADKAAASAPADSSQRLKLQTDYGQAVMWSKGFAARETRTALARTDEEDAGAGSADERLKVYLARFLRSFAGGELQAARQIAEDFVQQAEQEQNAAAFALGKRQLGMACLVCGDFIEARRQLETALSRANGERTASEAPPYGLDTRSSASGWLAITNWQLGEVDQARTLMQRAAKLADQTGHPPTIVNAKWWGTILEACRGDPAAALCAAEATARLGRQHELAHYISVGDIVSAWAAGRLNDPAAAADALRTALAGYMQSGNKVVAPWFHGMLGELEFAAGFPDVALASIEKGLEIATQTGDRFADSYLYRQRGDILLKGHPANPAPAEDAYRTAITIAQQQGARSYDLLASLSLAKLYQSTARPADAHAVLAPALEGFSPTPEMPEIEEAQALLAALQTIDEVKADKARRQQRGQLHVAYGNALIAARGFGAPETTEAFARARELAFGEKDASERLAADYGLWVGSLVRGELSPMRTYAETFLGDVAARPDSPEAGVAHRAQGITHWFAGEFIEARHHLERALALFQSGRDDDLAFRFGQDAGVAAMLFLALTLWPLGDIGRAVALVGDAESRIAGLPHIGTRAFGRMHAALFALMLGDMSRAAPNAAELARLTRDHDLPVWRAFGVFLEGLASGQSGPAGGRLEDMRRGVELLREQNIPWLDGLLKIALAEAEARAGDVDRALAILDEALATCDRFGHRTFEAELHRARGKMLLMRGPANPATAEEALLTAIAVAKQQTTRSFELRAALSLAELYQSTGRPADAHAVLAPALEGFSPTPEMPEIAEAQALLATLSQTDEVKAQAAQRHRMTQLQVAYGNALIAARGFGAPETAEAFERARQSAFSAQDTPERLAADFGLWAGSYTRGELPSMRAQAAAFLADVEARPDSPEAGVAHRVQGITHWFAGEFVEARDHLERALALFEPGRDDDLAYRFGMDPGVPAMAYLAFVLWSFGEIDCALSLAERMRGRTAGLTHANTLALGTMHAAAFELMRGDRPRIRTSALELARIAREHDLRLFRAFDDFFGGWMAADDGALPDGIERMRRGAENLRAQNALVFDGLLKIALSEAEARAGDLERAVATLDEALATTERAGFRAFEAELNRTRGEVLLECDPANPAPAQEAFQRAIAVAKRQSTRSFELRAALSLAKLYQSSSRPADARAVLSPALEGFEPTPEMPEIAQAQALLAG